MKSKILQSILAITGFSIASIALITPVILSINSANAQTPLAFTTPKPKVTTAPAPTAKPTVPQVGSGPVKGDAGGFVPCGNTPDDPCNVSHLFKGFIVIVNYLVVMAGFVAVLAIVFAGFMMVASQGEPGALTSAKGRLSGAVIGLVIVAAAYVLINALLSGSFSIGVCNGGKILTDPKSYIEGIAGCDTK